MEKKSDKILEGSFLKYDSPNSLGYIYTKECLQKAVEEFEKRKEIQYPLFGGVGEREYLDIHEISHKVTDLRIDEDKKELIGQIEILNTPAGEKLLDMIIPELNLLPKLKLSASGFANIGVDNTVKSYSLRRIDVIINSEDDLI